MGAPDPLMRSVQAVQFTDAEISRIMSMTAAEAKRIIGAVGPGSTRGVLTSMAALNAQAWGSTKSAIGIGIGDAVYGATEMGALFDERLMTGAGIPNQRWKNSLIAQASTGIQSVVSRKENGISLSDRVYKAEALSTGKIHDTINVGLALGKSPKEIAKDVEQYIRPDVPGGVSHAAMRLGRTEVLNAFHRTSINKYIEDPWVEVVEWNLSGSHPKPDECNEYAEAVTFPGGKPGQWKPEKVPGKPHPNCLCYVTPVALDLDDFAAAFEAGAYDDYIEGQMGCGAHG